MLPNLLSSGKPVMQSLKSIHKMERSSLKVAIFSARLGIATSSHSGNPIEQYFSANDLSQVC